LNLASAVAYTKDPCFFLDYLIAQSYSDGLNGRGSIQGRGRKFFFTSRRPDQLWGPPSLYLMGNGALSTVVKRPGLEADHPPPSSAEVKNGGARPSLLIRLHGVVFN
jgi:hypothetical protein